MNLRPHRRTLPRLQESHKLAVRGFATRAALLSGSDVEGWTDDREEDFEDEYSGCRLGSAALAKWAKQQAQYKPAAEGEEEGEWPEGPVGEVVAHLTQVEKSLDFQMHLLGAMSQMALDTTYSEASCDPAPHLRAIQRPSPCPTHPGEFCLRFDAVRELAAGV